MSGPLCKNSRKLFLSSEICKPTILTPLSCTAKLDVNQKLIPKMRERFACHALLNNDHRAIRLPNALAEPTQTATLRKEPVQDVQHVI